jgi:hypothetical protein
VGYDDHELSSMYIAHVVGESLMCSSDFGREVGAQRYHTRSTYVPTAGNSTMRVQVDEKNTFDDFALFDFGFGTDYYALDGDEYSSLAASASRGANERCMDS